MLCKHPEAMQRLVEEVRGTFEKDEDITLAQVLRLKYLGAVLEEALRLYPPGMASFVSCLAILLKAQQHS